MVFANNAVAQSTFQDLGSGHAKSIDIRGSPSYGIWQSNPSTRNYFAGKTGVGTVDIEDLKDVGYFVILKKIKCRISQRSLCGILKATRKAAQLIVGGDIVLEKGGKVLTARGSDKLRSAVLGASSEHEVVNSGNVIMDEDGTATVVLIDVTPNDQHVYSLTPIGVAMPGLFISKPVSSMKFQISGGVPNMTVSWTVRSVNFMFDCSLLARRKLHPRAMFE